MTRFSTILIANRGEIALRVIRSAQALGYRTVAVHSDADAEAPHVRAADLAVAIGPAPAAASYLRADRLIEAALETGAEAVHPGYGFLSENAEFAAACAAAGLCFIGPPPEAIALMGSKRAARAAMLAAGVSCVPGYEGTDQSDARLCAEAARLGFPVMVKASAGGGGRGLRIVTAPEALPQALAAARSEARAGFGSDELILERALIGPRHVEIQILADAQGHVLHLGERDCSVQRRHQKLIEEAPSPALTPDLRAAMGAAAVQAARACGYVGAGTVEFLLDAGGGFHFLEMNTRIQVEHPVTEAVTGLDLVEWQLRIAAGEALPLTQDAVALSGWAIEARLCAEDPRQGFRPQTGRVLAFAAPQGAGLRCDHALEPGLEIGPHYDPMLGKLIAHGATRAEALRRLARALDETRVLGVATNRAFLAAMLRDRVFAEGAATTAFVEEQMQGHPTATAEAAPPGWLLALAGALIVARGAGADRTPRRWPVTVQDEAGTRHPLALTVTAEGAALAVEARIGATVEALTLLGCEPAPGGGEFCHWRVGGIRRRLAFVRDGARLCFDIDTGHVALRDVTHSPPATEGAGGSGVLRAPMDGTVTEVRVGPGQSVTRGQVLAVLDAMKMEHPLVADTDGVVTDLTVAPGTQVRIRQVLARILPSHPPKGD